MKESTARPRDVEKGRGPQSWGCGLFLLWLGAVVAPQAGAIDDVAFERCRSMQNDVSRLQCYDNLAPSAAATTAEEVDPVREAIDKFLARSLNDPTSPIGYEVSDAFACTNIGANQEKADAQCVCYVINAKNRMGAYTGAKVRFARVFTAGQNAFAMDLPQQPVGGFRACTDANLKPRSADFIRAHVE